MSKSTDFQKLEAKATFTEHHLLTIGNSLARLSEALPNTKYHNQRFRAIRKNYEEIFQSINEEFVLRISSNLINTIAVEGL